MCLFDPLAKHPLSETKPKAPKLLIAKTITMLSIETQPFQEHFQQQGPVDADNVVTSVGLYDVLCGRDKTAFQNVGNRRFRVTVSLHLERYMGANSRKDKSIIIKSVAALVRSTGGRFLQRKGDTLIQLNEKQTHEKVGHALRDMAMASSKSSAAAKAKKERAIAKFMASEAVPMAEPETVVSQVEPVVSQEDPAVSPEEEDRAAFRPSIFDFENLPTLESQENAEIVTSIEPEPAHRRSSISIDDSMLQWLVGESDALMDSVFQL